MKKYSRKNVKKNNVTVRNVENTIDKLTGKKDLTEDTMNAMTVNNL